MNRYQCSATGLVVCLGMLLLSLEGFGQTSFQSCSNPSITAVPVANISALYDAVNNSSYAGKKIILAPGPAYYLDASFPNSGRLELQENMLLCGQDGNSASVVIDASNLLSASYNPNATGQATTGPVRIGRGANTIEWMTIQNDLAGTGLIETDLPPTTVPTRIRVANVKVDRGARGIDFRVVGTAYNTKTVEGEFVGNTVQHNTRGMGQGLRITINGATSVAVKATLQGNTFDANQVGLLAASQTTTNRITVDSKLDLFTNNGAGCWLIGGLGSANILTFTARDDQFVNNNQIHPQYSTGGGVVGIAGANGSSNNRARVEFFNSLFSNNEPNKDVNVFGYYETAQVAPGTNNVLELGLRPIDQTPTIDETQSLPFGEGNAVIRLDLLTQLSQAQMWVGLKNSDDVGTKFDLLAEIFRNGVRIGSGQVNDVAGGSSGFNNARLDAINLALSEQTYLGPRDTLSIKVSTRIASSSSHRSGTARLWFNDSAANSRFSATVGIVPGSYYLLYPNSLGTNSGLGPKKMSDVFVDRAVGGNSFITFGEWKITLP
jgi:hypothetical protein